MEDTERDALVIMYNRLIAELEEKHAAEAARLRLLNEGMRIAIRHMMDIKEVKRWQYRAAFHFAYRLNIEMREYEQFKEDSAALQVVRKICERYSLRSGPFCIRVNQLDRLLALNEVSMRTMDFRYMHDACESIANERSGNDNAVKE